MLRRILAAMFPRRDDSLGASTDLEEAPKASLSQLEILRRRYPSPLRPATPSRLEKYE